MDDWNSLYKEGKFSIATDRPSRIVVYGFSFLQSVSDANVLDIGCGNGRNSYYASGLGAVVDCVDIAQIMRIDPILQKKITFHKSSISDFMIRPERYSAIIATRIIQYISPSEVRDLFRKIADGLNHDGVLMMNYTQSGGIFDNACLDIMKYSHDIEDVKDWIDGSGLEIMSCVRGLNISSGVNYTIPNKTYDVLAKKSR